MERCLGMDRSMGLNGEVSGMDLRVHIMGLNPEGLVGMGRGA